MAYGCGRATYRRAGRNRVAPLVMDTHAPASSAGSGDTRHDVGDGEPLQAPRLEGFWRTGPGCRLPMPVPAARPWSGREAFVLSLRRVQREAGRFHFKGSSSCRLCGRANGSAEFRLGGWRWPSGFAHYIEDHGVVPTEAFRSFVDAFVTGT